MFSLHEKCNIVAILSLIQQSYVTKYRALRNCNRRRLRQSVSCESRCNKIANVTFRSRQQIF